MYFKDFPIVSYRFGNNEQPVLFPKLNTYVDLVDRVSNDAAAYQKYTIQDGERPDILSHKLYGSVKYYWTFFALNDTLRESGWPLTIQETYDTAKKHYPNQTIVTEDNWFKGKFKIGATVSGNTSGTTGKIVQTRPDLGQIIVGTLSNFNDGEVVSTGTGTGIETITVKSQSPQYDSTHHYENSDKEWVDIDPLDQQTSGLTKVTHMDRFIEFNEDLRQINVLSRNIVEQVHNEFMKSLRG